MSFELPCLTAVLYPVSFSLFDRRDSDKQEKINICLSVFDRSDNDQPERINICLSLFDRSTGEDKYLALLWLLPMNTAWPSSNSGDNNWDEFKVTSNLRGSKYLTQVVLTNAHEPILRKITSDSFFPNPLSPFKHGPLPLQWPEIPSRALHLLLDPAGELPF